MIHRRMPSVLAFIATSVLVVAAANAQAVDANGYRLGVPPTIVPPAVAAPDEVDMFRRAWRRAGAPRIVVFWNRELTDELATAYVRTRTVEHSRRTEAWAGAAPGAAVAGATDAGRLSVEVETRRQEPPARQAMPERTRWPFESAFHGAFAEAGVSLVSRPVALRSEALGAVGDQPNIQALEMKAARRRADFAIEVLTAPSPTASGQHLHRVRVTHLASARIVADLTSEARPVLSGPRPYVATNRGFEPAPPPAQTAEGTGRELAMQTMAALRSAISRR